MGWHADDEQLFQGKSEPQSGKRDTESRKLPKYFYLSDHSDHSAIILPFTSFLSSITVLEQCPGYSSAKGAGLSHHFSVLGCHTKL